MKTVKDSCVLKKHALNVNVSDQVAKLEKVIADLDQGQEFFERTHITEGLRKLALFSNCALSQHH